MDMQLLQNVIIMFAYIDGISINIIPVRLLYEKITTSDNPNEIGVIHKTQI